MLRGRTSQSGDASKPQHEPRGHIDVRGSGVAVVVSMLVHAGALAWVATDHDHDDDHEAQSLALDVAPRIVTQNIEPDDPAIEVTFFEYEAPSQRTAATAAATSPASSTTTAPPKRGRFSTTTAATTTGGTGVELGGGEPGPPGRSPYMTMRQPGKEPLKGMSGAFWEKFAENTKPLPPPPDIPGERLGDQIAELRAKMKRAGRYSPEELGAMREELVALNEARDKEELKPAGGGTYKTEKETFRAKVNADGSVKLEDKPENMDSQDKMMLRRGIDPYARNKLAYLDRTREQRVAIGKRHREQELKKSVIYMQQHIARLWSMTTDEAKRKQGLFELWDECSETGTPEEIAGGEAARAFVMAHIRATARYTPDELRALNATRHSKQEFAP